jgi:hypothetical protein
MNKSLFTCLIDYYSIAKPEQIAVDTLIHSYGRQGSTLKSHDLEVIHTYTLHNKGPSDATRTEVKLMWPMLSSAAFNEQPPLLYGIEIPSVSRVAEPNANNDRCYIYKSVS